MVRLIYRNQVFEVPAGLTVREAMKQVGLNPEITLAVREGKLLHENTVLQDGDEIKLIAVISGGGV
ncbi:MoaD/ThiS family protein [Thermoflexus sp.]|uniref:MoaD/ThiS family protein n=1 Tax=Thermoflexus sp. TaxID=1969742 RepID=UPI00177091B1|nr:MoaD/ThiS family protein [Thermoflexus sp.]